MNISLQDLYSFPLDFHNNTAEGTPIEKKPFKYFSPYSTESYKLRDDIYDELVDTEYDDYDVIYRILFNDGRSYIGQAKHYYTSQRYLSHLYLLHNYSNVKYSGKKINTAIKEVGINAIQILKKYRYIDTREHYEYNLIDNSLLLNDVERYYIMLFDSVKNGYNSKKG